MPKPPPKREPDPMAHVVDRLLAQLPGLHGAPDPYLAAKGPSGIQVRTVPAPRTFTLPGAAGLWGRVALGSALGIMIVGWPYFRACGLPLFGYLFALVALMLAGLWTAVLAWNLRNAPAHVVSLILLSWGVALTAGEILPRSGYAAAAESWQCEAPGSGPAWMRWFAGD